MGESSQPSNPSVPPALLAELDARVGELESTDAKLVGPVWGAMHKLLLKARVDPGTIAQLVMRRDGAGVRRLVNALAGRTVDVAAPAAAPSKKPEVDPETLKSAMRAFRKRLKLTRLDHESRLGVGPMTGGKKADFDAIMPPQEFPPPVWDALVAQGKLKALGRGFYMLVDDQQA